MRQQTVWWTLSVVACLLSCLAALTLARADPAPQSDQRSPPDSSHTPAGHADSLGLPVSGVPRSPESDSKTHSDENWRHKMLGDTATGISDSSSAAQDIPDTDGNSRFGVGNPRLQLKTPNGDSGASASVGEDDGVKPKSISTSKPTQSQSLQKSSLSDVNKNMSSHSLSLDGHGSSKSGTAGVSLPRPQEDRMYGDDPSRGIPVPADRSRSSRNSSRAGSKNNGDMVVYPSPRKEYYQDDIQLGCRELRARRYITDGFCTSEDPIREVVCTGNCLPIKQIPWYAEFIKTMATSKLRQYECVEDFTRRKKVKLLCQDGSIRTYRIKVVKSCRCERIGSRGNRTSPRKGRRKDKRKRKGKNSKNRDKKWRNRRRRRRKSKRDSKNRAKGSGKKAAATDIGAVRAKKDRSGGSRSDPEKRSGS